jgi:hypothetical protein
MPICLGRLPRIDGWYRDGSGKEEAKDLGRLIAFEAFCLDSRVTIYHYLTYHWLVSQRHNSSITLNLGYF